MSQPRADRCAPRDGDPRPRRSLVPASATEPLVLVDHHRAHLDHHWVHTFQDPFWRCFVVAGSGASVGCAGLRHDLTPGVLHLIPAWVQVTSACLRPMRQDWLHVLAPAPWREGALAPGALGRALAAPWTVADPSLVQALASLADLPRRSHRVRLRAEALVLTALDRLADQLPADARALLEAGPADDRLTRVERYVASHLAEDFTVASLAARAGLRPSQFASACTARTGLPPMTWLRQVRIRAAADLLRSTAATVEEIATRVGFANRHHFTRVFTAQIGQGPAAWRRTGGGDTPAGDPDIG